MAGRRTGFTLVEVLLVSMIAVLAAAIMFPQMARSYRGAQLRASVRSVVMAHKMARSLAVLNQQYMGIVFSREKNDLAIVALPIGVSLNEKERFLSGNDMPAAPADAASSNETGQVEVRETRKLEDGVSIEEFEVAEGSRDDKGNFWIQYYPNGMCDKYSLRLQDDRRESVKINIDPVSGAVKTEKRSF